MLANVCPQFVFTESKLFNAEAHTHIHLAPQCAQTNRLSLRSDNKRPYASRYNDFWLLYCCSIQLPFRYLNFSCSHSSACLLALSHSFSHSPHSHCVHQRHLSVSLTSTLSHYHLSALPRVTQIIFECFLAK